MFFFVRKSMLGNIRPLPNSVTLVLPGYTVETYTNRLGFRDALLNRKETMQSFGAEMDDNTVCPGLSDYSITWLATPAFPNERKVAFVLRNRATQNRAGFALCTVRKPEKSLFIDILCAREKKVGAGTALTQSIEEYARANGISHVELVSVADPQTVKFYKKMGYFRGPPGTSPADRVRARRVYSRIKNWLPDYVHENNIAAGYTNVFDGLVFNQDRNERIHRLPKFHKKIGTSKRKKT